MVDVDDELRTQLQRERLSSAGVDARAVLVRLAPTLRRAHRRRRAASATAAAGIAIAGIAGTALAMGTFTDDPSMIVEGSESGSVNEVVVAPTSQPTTTIAPAPSVPAVTESEDAAPDPQSSVAPAPSVVSPAASTPHPTVYDVTIPPVTEPPLAPPGTTAPPAATTPPGDTAPPSTSPTPNTPPAPPTTVRVDDEIETYECDCGVVTVDQATGALDVQPAPGYSYRLEDVERHDDRSRWQTVQFTGDGEDCELHVPLP